MYQDYFRLAAMPFSIAPDPHFLFMSDRHREAIAHLLYGVHGAGGIVLLTGEVGTGKTTLCRSLLEQLPDNIDVAFVLNPRLSVVELLHTVCEEYHIQATAEPASIKSLVDALNDKLLSAHAQGRRAILIVDEAQNLEPAVLEQLRLLTNLETNTHKLLQIFLIGQPELQTMLAQPDMRQVAQRVVAHYHLSHLSRAEVAAYIAHRLSVAGASPLIFPAALAKQVYRASRGTPRLINLICDRALLGTYAQGSHQVTGAILRKAISEVMMDVKPPQRFRRATLIGILSLSCGLAALLVVQPGYISPSPPSPEKFTPPDLPASAPVILLAASSAQASSSPPITKPLTQLEWPNKTSTDQSLAAAFGALFNLYHFEVTLKPGSPPCSTIENQGMQCYVGHGGISDLSLIDQPVLIPLSAPGKTSIWAALTTLDHQAATLLIEGQEQHIALNELSNAWSGQFTALWSPPPGFNGELALHQHGIAVRWLRHAMGLVDGIADNGSDLFDPVLAQRIRAFQLLEGIQPDGLAGPLTLMRLNMRNSTALPRLIVRKEG
jgi:general secretion pathway protein A